MQGSASAELSWFPILSLFCARVGCAQALTISFTVPNTGGINSILALFSVLIILPHSFFVTLLNGMR